MAPSSLLVLIGVTATLSSVSAYSSSAFTGSRLRTGRSSSARRSSNALVMENFGFDFAEDQVENSNPLLLGEANYKQFVTTVNDNSFLNRQYNVIRRVNELDLLQKTADLGILSKLEKNGVDLETIESLLPLAEQYGLLTLAGNNQQLLINGAAPLLVEGAPLLLPVVAGALDIGPVAFYAAAAALAGSDYALLANHVEIPFVGLSAGFFLGLLLVPLSVVTGGLGVVLASAKK